MSCSSFPIRTFTDNRIATEQGKPGKVGEFSEPGSVTEKSRNILNFQKNFQKIFELVSKTIFS